MNMQRMDAFQCAQLQKILENPESNTIWYDSLEEALKKGVTEKILHNGSNGLFLNRICLIFLPHLKYGTTSISKNYH